MSAEEYAIVSWLLDTLEAMAGNYDSELREHIINAANRLYDMKNEKDEK